MSTARLTSSLWVSAFLRRVQNDGGFAHVLAKGDPTAGAVIISTRSRQGEIRSFERSYTASGAPAWIERGTAPLTDSEALDAMGLARKRDPDVWWIEADVEDASPYLDGPILDTHKR
jgi:hypothetical protein